CRAGLTTFRGASRTRSPSRSATSSRSTRRSGRRLRSDERQMESGDGAVVVLERERPSVSAPDRGDDGEPEAERTVALRRPRKQFRGEPGPRVADRKEQRTADPFGGQPHRPVTVTRRVVHEVVDGLTEPV